ncbi:MAG: hypothetical protein HC905_10540 [Bacteroidales bacterium]|nr:hypothetical protein [Bacteroidales bacterium]
MPAFRTISHIPVGVYGNVRIFATKAEYIPKPLYQPNVLTDIAFDAETIHEEDKRFISTDKSFSVEGAECRTGEEAYEGSYSAKLSPQSPFAFTVTLENIKPGEFIQVSGMRKGKDGLLVASGVKEGAFYKTSQQISRDKGWDVLDLQFTVPAKLPQKKLKLYIWYNGSDSAYFDNFRIIRREEYQKRNGL